MVLDSATLETVKVGKSGNHELLNCDDHQGILRKNNRDIAEVRPDIAHQVCGAPSSCHASLLWMLMSSLDQCLLTLLDSPLNKAGKLQVYVRTQKNVLIEVNPQTRIPRTFKRFSGLMGIPVSLADLTPPRLPFSPSLITHL